MESVVFFTSPVLAGRRSGEGLSFRMLLFHDGVEAAPARHVPSEGMRDVRITSPRVADVRMEPWRLNPVLGSYRCVRVMVFI